MNGPTLVPPIRQRWVHALPPAKRSTALLREYLSGRVGCVDKRESAACRTMLMKLGGLQADDNATGVELAIIKGVERNTVNIFFTIPGLGRVEWLPVLVTGMSDKLGHIIRESGPTRAIPIEREKAIRGIFDDPQGGRGIPPKTETVLIPGKKV